MALKLAKFSGTVVFDDENLDAHTAIVKEIGLNGALTLDQLAIKSIESIDDIPDEWLHCTPWGATRKCCDMIAIRNTLSERKT